MTINCNDRERIFEDGTAAEWASLEAHAGDCAVCREELRVWRSLSIAAAEMRDYSDSPMLWPRIEEALVQAAEPGERNTRSWGWLTFWKHVSVGWQTAAAGALVLLLAVSASWFYVHQRGLQEPHDPSLLKSKALTEVERTETAYIRAIDKLAADAKPQLDRPATPLLSSYREKLLLIDSAIDDLRAQAGQNASNAHLRYQLLAMYQEKQKTLEEVLEEKR
jgi:hypothetical protein